MKLRHTLLILMALPFWLGFAPVLQAQEVDSVLTENAVDTAALLTISDNILKNVRPHRNLKNFKPDPIRAMWLGLVLPGAGQIYNRKYWKLPIIYGGFLGCVYALTSIASLAKKSDSRESSRVRRTPTAGSETSASSPSEEFTCCPSSMPTSMQNSRRSTSPMTSALRYTPQ